MKSRLLGAAAIAGAALSLTALLASHFILPQLDLVSDDIVAMASGEASWLVGAGMSLLAVSSAAMASALPEKVQRSQNSALGKVLLYLSALALVGTGAIVVVNRGLAGLDPRSTASLTLATSSVLITSAMVLIGAGLDLTLQPDNTFRRYRVLALLAAMLLLLFFLTWSSLSGLFQRAFLAMVLFWLMTAGYAVLGDWQEHGASPSA